MPSRDYGINCKGMQFQASINNGYMVQVEMMDPNFNMLNELIRQGYLRNPRNQILSIRFRIKAGYGNVSHPEKATAFQIAYVTAMHSQGEGDKAYIYFTAIDPPSWYLNTGNASGKVYKGSIKQVIQQVVAEYAPQVKLEISDTIDSTNNKWGMMRQDPKTFIRSLLEWSSSITHSKTNWVVTMDGYNLKIREQASIVSRPRAYYRYWDGSSTDTINGWHLATNNAMSITETKLVTQGLSAVDGQYLDRITDQQERLVFVKDSSTPNKLVAATSDATQKSLDQSFHKPDDSVGSGPAESIGWTSISSIPEIYSAGDLGISYADYIDGQARKTYLDLTYDLMQLDLEVIGHGEWSSCEGLGTDTVYIKWMKASRNNEVDGGRLWFLTGNWLVSGFRHEYTVGTWSTNLILSRYDYNSVAKKVGTIAQK